MGLFSVTKEEKGQVGVTIWRGCCGRHPGSPRLNLDDLSNPGRGDYYRILPILNCALFNLWRHGPLCSGGLD